jgi:hypothetical protein
MKEDIEEKRSTAHTECAFCGKHSDRGNVVNGFCQQLLENENKEQ